MQGFVYLLQEQDFSGNPTGLYKIGKTSQKSILDRTKQYKAGNARPVTEHYSVAVTDCQQVETALHREYRRYRLKAGGGDEWFTLDRRMVADVMQNMRSYGTKRQPSRMKSRLPPATHGGGSLVWLALAISGALWLFSVRNSSTWPVRISPKNPGQILRQSPPHPPTRPNYLRGRLGVFMPILPRK